jgi:hypothetical protein
MDFAQNCAVRSGVRKVRYVSVTFFEDVPFADCDGELEHAARSSRLAAAAPARHRLYMVTLSGRESDESVHGGYLPDGKPLDNVIFGCYSGVSVAACQELCS